MTPFFIEGNRGTPQSGVIPAFNSVFDYTDSAGHIIFNGRVRMWRPQISDQTFRYDLCQPGGRVRFTTDATDLTIHLFHPAIVVGAGIEPGDFVGVVLVDGVITTTFAPASPQQQEEIDVVLTFGDATPRTIEILMPYSAAIDFSGVTLQNGTVSAAPARPSTKWAVHGDSITHGYRTTRVDKTWPYLLGTLRNVQAINMGYASRQVIAQDGVGLASMNCDRIITAIGANGGGTQSVWEDFFGNIRATQPSVPITAITLFWTTNPNAETLRQHLRDAVAALSDPNIQLIEGTTLATNSISSFPDGVHPNDTGAAEIATNLAAAIS